jgi:diacylglycerol kinase (ATP)
VSGRNPQALVVANPAAGGSPMDVANKVTNQLVRRGFNVTTHLTARRGDAVQVVSESVRRAPHPSTPLDLVIAVGGDGTVREVAEGVVRGNGRWPGETGSTDIAVRETPALFVAPGGTGNSFYRALFADIPVSDALEMVLGEDHTGARIRWLDIGRFVEGDQAVILGASAGFLARVLDQARAAPAGTGRQRYEQSALELIGRPDDLGTDVRVLIDGTVLIEGHLLLVALGGARHRGGSFELLPRSMLDDGLFDVCAIRATSPARLAELLLAVTTGTHLEQPEVAYAKGNTVTIEATGKGSMLVESDGDVVDGKAQPVRTVTFEVIGAALKVWAGDPPLCG